MNQSHQQLSRLASAVATEDREDSRRVREVRRDESLDATARERRRRRLLVVLTAIFVASTAFNLSGLNPLLPRAAILSAEEIELWVLSEVEMVVDDIDAWRAEWGSLPDTIDDFVDGSGTWSYRRLDGDQYQVAFTAEGTTVAYDSSQEQDAFFSRLYARKGTAQ